MAIIRPDLGKLQIMMKRNGMAALYMSKSNIPIFFLLKTEKFLILMARASL
jgi:hypothetical protein